jgi:hypothetical protein
LAGSGSGAGSSAGARLDVGLHVAAGDAPALAGPFDLGHVELVLPNQLAHHRGEQLGLLLHLGRLLEERLHLLLSGLAFLRFSLGLGLFLGFGLGLFCFGLRLLLDFGLGFGFRLLLGCGLSGFARGLVGVADHHQLGADLDRFPLLHQDLEDGPSHRRGDLGVDLVGRDLYEDLVFGDGVADLLRPPQDGSLGDRLPQLGHGYRRGQDLPPSAGCDLLPTSVFHQPSQRAWDGRV